MIETKHPKNIVLGVSPLGEAWLEVRWKLQQLQGPVQGKDPDFPFALGLFYDSVKPRYRFRKDLDASHAPLELLPYIVRHQFWTDDGVWPVLQLGPGVATVNFTKPYDWASFRKEAQFLLEHLLRAYAGKLPQTESITLRYQNRDPFDFLEHDIIAFLSTNLNTTIGLPKGVPGAFASKPFPTNLILRVSYNLVDPIGQATIIVSTGVKASRADLPSSPEAERVAMWQVEIAAQGTEAPTIADLPAVMKWLDSAHTAVHEWFFSLIDGKLFQEYGGKNR
jgi:uncharacterized protein (TIGR04255 family)